jgi:hypothetical protein
VAQRLAPFRNGAFDPEISFFKLAADEFAVQRRQNLPIRAKSRYDPDWKTVVKPRTDADFLCLSYPGVTFA